MKKALITGVTGQDGSYLAEFLLEKGYEVHGMIRRSSSYNQERLEDVLSEEEANALYNNEHFHLHYGDVTDALNVTRIIGEIKPDEIYNLAAQSHVRVSFDMPGYTLDVDAKGTLNILEAVRILGLTEKTRVYQASTSELFGKVQEVLKKKQLHFILGLLMELQRFMDFGLQRIIVSPLICLL